MGSPPPAGHNQEVWGLMTSLVRNLVDRRSPLSLVPQAFGSVLPMLSAPHSNSPTFFGKICSYFVPVSLTISAQDAGLLLPGLVGACRPPPVHSCTFDSSLTTHCRVRVEPHAFADCAHNRNEDVACMPSSATLPLRAVTRSVYCLTAGTFAAFSNGWKIMPMCIVSPAPAVFHLAT